MNRASLHHVYFVGSSNDASGQVSDQTIFHYRQLGDIIWANYQGGEIRFGVMSGHRVGDQLFFTYHHLDRLGNIKTGKCESQLSFHDGKLQLHEKWQWLCDDFSKGQSIVIEQLPG